MVCKVMSSAGACIGWGVSIWIAVFNPISHERSIPIMLLSLTTAMICCGYLALTRHQRPLGAAYQLGYETGRRDAIRDATRRRNAEVFRLPVDRMGREQLERIG